MGADMSITDADEPAFPYPDHGRRGMTLRDYFAAKAMQGLIASRHTDYENGYYEESCVGATAYAMADAMLKAREA